jgi:nucleotide-binding universal stress UspA family protein
MKPFSKILVPIDFTPHSAEAVQRALQIARDSNAAVVLVHFYEPTEHPLLSGSVAYIREQLERMSEPLQRRLEAARRDAQAQSGCDVSCRLLYGGASAGIVGVASEENFDLIVMGTHGRTGVSRWMLGSVAEKVVRGAACGVLTVKAPASGAAVGAASSLLSAWGSPR